MSDSQNTAQNIQLKVTMGQLPEDFCPGSPQELGNAIADRLMVVPENAFSSFVTGCNMPARDEGPWLKCGTEWWVWSNAAGTYVPITKGGFNTQQFFATSGTFVVPGAIYRLRIRAWGAGGGGGETSGVNPGGGGGGGAYCEKIVDVVPNQIIPFVVGVGGIAGTPGITGGNTTILTLAANGGAGAPGGATNAQGGAGGTATGGLMNFSGGSGGFSIQGDPGEGGNSPQGGQGGMSQATSAIDARANGAFPGGAGAGGYSTVQLPGNGADGAILIEY